MSRSGASKHPGSRLARLIIAGHAASPYVPYAPYASYAPIRSLCSVYLVCSVCTICSRAPRGGHACTCCFQNGTSEKCRLYRLYCFPAYYFLLHYFTRSCESWRTCRQRETAGSPFISIQISRRCVSTMDGHIGFRLSGHWEGAGSVSSRSVLGQSGNTRSSRICAKVELCSYYAFACRG